MHMYLCCELNVCVHSKFNNVKILAPKEMVLEGEASLKSLDHKLGALMNGINILIKETPEGEFAHISNV